MPALSVKLLSALGWQIIFPHWTWCHMWNCTVTNDVFLQMKHFLSLHKMSCTTMRFVHQMMCLCLFVCLCVFVFDFAIVCPKSCKRFNGIGKNDFMAIASHEWTNFLWSIFRPRVHQCFSACQCGKICFTKLTKVCLFANCDFEHDSLLLLSFPGICFAVACEASSCAFWKVESIAGKVWLPQWNVSALETGSAVVLPLARTAVC